MGIMDFLESNFKKKLDKDFVQDSSLNLRKEAFRVIILSIITALIIFITFFQGCNVAHACINDLDCQNKILEELHQINMKLDKPEYTSMGPILLKKEK